MRKIEVKQFESPFNRKTAICHEEAKSPFVRKKRKRKEKKNG
jgi:hypothetical protein